MSGSFCPALRYNKKLRMLQNEEIKNFGIFRLNHLHYMRNCHYIWEQAGYVECTTNCELVTDWQVSIVAENLSYQHILKQSFTSHNPNILTPLSNFPNKWTRRDSISWWYDFRIIGGLSDTNIAHSSRLILSRILDSGTNLV